MKHETGDLLSMSHGILVHGCNAQGAMRSGIAGLIRDKWPGVYTTYKNAYDKQKQETGHTLQLGRVIWHTISKEPKFTIANAITQEFYGRDPNRVYVSYDAIATAFERIGAIAREHQLPVHYPLIGAGLANGDWTRIEAIISEKLEGVDHTLWTLPGTPKPGAPKPR